MGYEILSALSVVVAIVLITVVVKHRGGAKTPAQFGELASIAAIWAFTMGPSMYLNPGLPKDGFFSPPIPGIDKALFWILALLFGMSALRTLTLSATFGRKLATALVGTFLAFLVFVGFGAAFGGRVLGTSAPPGISTTK